MTTDFDLITVTPWRSGGRHRLYVSDRRQSLGFLDESTGTLVLTDARYRPVVEQALRTAGYPQVRSERADSESMTPVPGGALGREKRTRLTSEESGLDRLPEPMVSPRRERLHAAARPTHAEAEGSNTPGESYARTRPETNDRPAEALGRHRDVSPLSTARDAPAAPVTDADPDPEQVWATLAAGRAPRSASVPHGRRDPATTLTALLLGEPPPDVRHEKVGAQVAALVDAEPLWHVLEVDGAEIDHLLIGPGGAFALSTKVYPGASVQVACESVVVDDTPHPWVRVGLHAGRRAGRTLSQACHQAVTVTTLLVIDAGRLTTRLPPPVGVVALDCQDLCRWLRAQPEILTPGTIAMLADTARQSDSWFRR